MDSTYKFFFAYGSKPEEAAEKVRRTASLLNRRPGYAAETWEDLRIAGRIIIDRVLAAIDKADHIVLDVSYLNENVLFEVGYAIARKKPLTILLLEHPEATHNWSQLAFLSGVGYTGFSDPEKLAGQLTALVPAAPMLSDLERSFRISRPRSLFYMPTYASTPTSRSLTRRLDEEVAGGVAVSSGDPTEYGLAPFGFYAGEVYATSATLVHMTGRAEARSQPHNARCAMIAGFARGLNRPTLIVADDDYVAPLDYKDLAIIGSGYRKIAERVDEWLVRCDALARPALTEAVRPAAQLRLATELRGLRLGEYVAEREAEVLEQYFVQTAEFSEVLNSRSVVFVGNKGVGKTANMLRAAAELREDKRNLVAVIKPSSYEIQSVVQVLRDYAAVDTQGYLIETLWRFLLLTEMALSAVRAQEALPSGIALGTPLAELRDYLDRSELPLREDFAVRLERVMSSASVQAPGPTSGVEAGRAAVNRSLHSTVIKDLRRLLGQALGGRERVAVLVDNLDKGWTRTADLPVLTNVLLGLLMAIGRVADDFQKQASGRGQVNVTLAVFLRGDIHDVLMTGAREPDKINVAMIDWSDQELLRRVIEERYLAVRPPGTRPDELWDRFFPVSVRGKPTLDYILSRILWRPRDLVFFCNAAITNAINADVMKVRERDVLTAERTYSQFAFDALLVANGITVQQLEEVLYEFAGGAATLTEDEVLQSIKDVLGVAYPSTAALEHLVRLGFLGLETSTFHFSFATNGRSLSRIKALAKKMARDTSPRYEIHPAYRAHLEITE